MYSRRKIFCLTASLLLALPNVGLSESVYETRAAFLVRAFGEKPPETELIWLIGETKDSVREILGHDYPALRVRYWCQANRSAWVLDEIGKELPITVGVIVDGYQINSLKVLVYRENRGGEVTSPAFTDQFNDVSLLPSKELDTSIDGISGATMSVNSLTRLAEMALFLSHDTTCRNER